MRRRSLILILALVAVVAGSCSGASTDPEAADRAVGEDSPGWDVDQAILRTEIIESALAAGQGREQTACVIDTTLGAGDFALADLEGIDLSARTSSETSAALATALADALTECGPNLRAAMKADIPGSSSIPDTHAAASECLTNGYADARREAYIDRFRGLTVVDEVDEDDPFPEVSTASFDIIDGCDAGGAVILGASNEGHLDTHSLSTLEWACLDSRIDPKAFMPAFPFPDEPGDALERLGAAVDSDVAFCEAWVAGREADDDAS